jgi:hypothetical protein
MQFDLDFTGNLPPSAQAGMAAVDSNANEKWRHIFDACVLAAAKKKQEITSDDVLTELERLPNAPSTHNLAAIGPAMQRAAEMGILRGTGRVERSKRKGKNGNIHSVWHSNYYAPF